MKPNVRSSKVHQGVLQHRAKALDKFLAEREKISEPYLTDLHPDFVELYIYLLYRKTLPVRDSVPKDALHQLTGLYVLAWELDDIQTGDTETEAILALSREFSCVLPDAETIRLMYDEGLRRTSCQDYFVDLIVERGDCAWLSANIGALPTEFLRDLTVNYSLKTSPISSLSIDKCDPRRYLEGRKAQINEEKINEAKINEEKKGGKNPRSKVGRKGECIIIF
jgi:hypothetical protein